MARVEHGGRIELRLRAGDTDPVEYDVELATPDVELHTVARVDAAGTVTFSEWSSGDPPPWLTALAKTALRAAHRTWSAEARWPRRITRWRPLPGQS